MACAASLIAVAWVEETFRNKDSAHEKNSNTDRTLHVATEVRRTRFAAKIRRIPAFH
ncbi:MAG: hypothetical protein AMXMBFR4_05180 [Candidatus Hydrogenedentota bacterium]